MFKQCQTILTFVVLFSLLLAACVPAAAPAPALTPALVVQGEPVAVGGNATGVVYEMKSSIHDGKPIKLVLWDWHGVRVDWYKKKAAEYSKMYPNVSFDIVLIPAPDFLTKVAAAVPVGEGPDILQFNTGHHTQVVGKGWADPFPEEMFNRAYLEENWVGFKEGHFYDEAGHFYYVPWGSMTAMLYVNKRLWDEAGLTEADYPKTWDDMVTVAKKLTKYDDTGNIEVSGFAFNGWTFPILFTDLIYEQGRYLQTKDSKGCQIDSPEGRRALETLIKFYDENINSRDFLGGGEAFETEKAAITWSWTFYTGVLHTTHPDLKFFTIKMPSFTGENLPSLGRQNYETSPVVPRYKPEERKKVAWDFLHWLHSREDNLIDLAFLHGIAPAYKKLWDHPRIVADPDMVALREVIDYKIFPGEYPNTLLAALDQNVGQNIIAGASVDEALKAGHEACNRVMQEADYWIIERLYRHDDAMIPDQP